MTTAESTVTHTNGDVSCPHHHPELGFPLRAGNFSFKYVCQRCEPNEQVYVEQIRDVSDDRLKTIYRYLQKRDSVVGLCTPEEELLSVTTCCIEYRGLDLPDTNTISMIQVSEKEYNALQQYHEEIGELKIKDGELFIIPLTEKECSYLNQYRRPDDMV